MVSLDTKKTRKNLRKRFKHHHKGAVELGQQADQQIEKFLIRRFDRLMSVRRFVMLWTSLFVLLLFCAVMQLKALTPYYQQLKPVPGGIYSEGIIGKFNNANPLYASSAPDTAVSRLVFSGLFKFDNNNNLSGDLASDFALSTSQTRYVVHLKKNITWHDGAQFKADDVVFTYQTIQNLEAQSPLYANWQGVKVSKLNDYAVVFNLPNPLSSFPYSLTNGILPAHLLKNTPAIQLRSAQFNSQPIGTGPFRWKFVELNGSNGVDRRQHVALSAFEGYSAGKPKLDGINITTFKDDQQMLSAFKKKQLNAMSGLESLPADMSSDNSIHPYTTPLTSEVMAFFNNSHPPLSDLAVRQALVSGANRSQIPSLLPYPVNIIGSPLLRGQLGYDSSIMQPAYNQAAATAALDKAGWVIDPSTGQRAKGGQPLRILMASQDTQEYTLVAHFLQKEWSKLGIKLDVQYYPSDDLQSQIIANHDYDILLYGINIGTDPDVFAYWDSKQASVGTSGHLNLSEYKSAVADQALEAGRTRADANLRAAKYKAFLTSWAADSPALALYQPNYLYVTRGSVFNYERKADNVAADRFYNVNQWMVRQRHQNL